MAHGHGDAKGAMGGAKMPGFTMDPNGTPVNQLLDGGFCTDCTILAGQVDVVFENGTRADIANGVYLHHMVVATWGNSTGKGKADWVNMCPQPKAANQGFLSGLLANLDLGSFSAGGGFVGGAVDEFVDYFTSPDGKINSGFFLPANTGAFLSGEIINYRPEPQEVYLRLELEWVPGKQGTDTIKTPLNVESMKIHCRSNDQV
jgi:hypothetical protein